MDVKLATALVAAGASVVAAFVSLSGVAITVIYNRNTQAQLEALKARLAARKSSADARRDYTYDARRRLYKECEPSIFQLLDAADSAHQRMAKLLDGSRPQLVADEYRLSTLYRVLMPAVVFTHVRERLTLFDLSIDPRIHLQYELGRLIGTCWSEDQALAAAAVSQLVYLPKEGPPAGEMAEPRIYKPQGVSSEHMEAFAAAMRRPGEAISYLSFAEFSRARQNKQHALFQAVLDLDYLLRSFTPAARPVLCRILHTQTMLFDLMARTRAYDDMDWTRTLGAVEGTFEAEKLYAQDDSFRAAHHFLKPKLQRIHERVHLHARTSA